MQRIHGAFKQRLSRVLLFLVILFLSACSTQSPFQPADGNDRQSEILQTDVGPVQLLKIVQPERPALAKAGNENDEINDDGETSPFFVQKLIKAEDGGNLVVDNKRLGKSKLTIPEGALLKDALISFKWAASGTMLGTIRNARFGPHGLQFRVPAKLELSYKAADLGGVIEQNLRVFYYNERSGVWELIGGKVDIKKKVIRVAIHHFSRYAIAHSQ